MARPRSKNSKLSKYNLGLREHEEEQLDKMLEEAGISFRMLQRALIRQWMKEGGTALIKYGIYKNAR